MFTVALAASRTARVVAAPGLTVIPVCDPVTEAVTVSVAVTDWAPEVFSVTPFVKVCTPASVVPLNV